MFLNAENLQEENKEQLPRFVFMNIFAVCHLFSFLLFLNITFLWTIWR